MALERMQVYCRKMKTKFLSFLSRSASHRVVRHLTPVIAIGLLAGCATAPESHMVSEPPPPAPTRSVTTTTTTTSPDTVPGAAVGYPTTAVVGYPANTVVTTGTPVAGTVIVTQQAPPALQTEVVLAQPEPRDVWIAGYWTWNDSRYQWMAGHWELPPNARAVWVAPTWQPMGHGYRYTEGYWN